MPRSLATSRSERFVTDGRTEQLSGVTYLPSFVMPMKLEVENSSTNWWLFASR